MKKKITISGSVSGTIATGSFQNLKPTFTWEEEFEIEEDVNIEGSHMTDLGIQARRKQLYDMSFMLLKEAESKALIERIEREREDLRFVASPTTGKMLPSVTSIIGGEFFVPPYELVQYASQSQIVHAKVAYYIDTDKWLDAKNIPAVDIDVLVVKDGSLGLPLDTGDFPAFLKKYPIDGMVNGYRGFDDKVGYCGEFDFHGIPKFKDAREELAIFDVKRSPSKDKDGMQLAAYCNLMNAKQGIIIPLNDKNKTQGYSKPIIYDEKALEGYFKLFLQKRKEFKKRYGI